MKALVLLSGGLDSTVLATLACRHEGGPSEVCALSFDYGQKHEREVASAKMVASRLRLADHRILHVGGLWLAQGSALLTDDVPMPKVSYEELAKSEGVSPTYVPYRNGTFLSIAAIYALQHDIERIYYAPHSEDARGWAYPDCTPEFNGAMASAIYIGTYHKVRLLTPFQWHTKADIVKVGAELRAPMHLTWSCYKGAELHCGTCPTCVGRQHAFQEANIEDPTEYYIRRLS